MNRLGGISARVLLVVSLAASAGWVATRVPDPGTVGEPCTGGVGGVGVGEVARALEGTSGSPATLPIDERTWLRGHGAADAARVSTERAPPNETYQAALRAETAAIPVPTDPERRPDVDPAAPIAALLGLGSGSAAEAELGLLLREQVREAREWSETQDARAEEARARYNLAVRTRVERLIQWFGEDGARLTLERSPFHLADPSGRVARLALVDGRFEVEPERDEPRER